MHRETSEVKPFNAVGLDHNHSHFILVENNAYEKGKGFGVCARARAHVSASLSSLPACQPASLPACQPVCLPACQSYQCLYSHVRGAASRGDALLQSLLAATPKFLPCEHLGWPECLSVRVYLLVTLLSPCQCQFLSLSTLYHTYRSRDSGAGSF